MHHAYTLLLLALYKAFNNGHPRTRDVGVGCVSCLCKPPPHARTYNAQPKQNYRIWSTTHSSYDVQFAYAQDSPFIRVPPSARAVTVRVGEEFTGFTSSANLNSTTTLSNRHHWTDEGVKQKDWQELAKEELGIDTRRVLVPVPRIAVILTHNHPDSLRTLQQIMKKANVQTARRNDMSDVERGAAVLSLEAEDPLGRIGNRKLKEKLALRTKHLTRDFIAEFRRTHNPAGAAARHPITRKIQQGNGEYPPELVAQSANVVGAMATSRSKNLITSKEIGKPIGKSKLRLNGLDNALTSCQTPNAGRREVKLTKVINRNSERYPAPAFDPIMEPYSLETPWTMIKRNIMVHLDDIYSAQRNYRIIDTDQFTLQFNASNTIVPDKYDAYNLCGMWNEITKGTAPKTRRMKSQTQKTDVGASSLEPTARSGTAGPAGIPSVKPHKRAYLTIPEFVVDDTHYTVKTSRCQIANGAAIWTTDPQTSELLIHADILASGKTKHAYQCEIGEQASVAKLFYNIAQVTMDGNQPASTLPRLPFHINLKHLKEEVQRQQTAAAIVKRFTEMAKEKKAAIYVEKYSGTHQAGNHQSLIGMTCDTLAHFSAYDSDLYLILVDIQGIVADSVLADGRRGGKVLNLFDLMIHSSNKSYGLGDAGRKGIVEFFSQHECNRFCRKLGMVHGRGAGGAKLDDTRITVIMGTAALRPDLNIFLSEIPVGGEDETTDRPQQGFIEGVIEFPPANIETTQQMVRMQSSTSEDPSDCRMTVMLSENLASMNLDAQDAALYTKVAHDAGAQGLLDEFSSALSTSLIRPVGRDIHLTLHGVDYPLWIAVPREIPPSTKIHYHAFAGSSAFGLDSDPTAPAGAAAFLEAFSHFSYAETEGKAAITRFEFRGGGAVTVIDFANSHDYTDGFVKGHLCDGTCKSLGLAPLPSNSA
ncbi:hypothetical protein NMY22_g3782 [Coprinellus aureogranulatus]|nr:hypothetical protein NMY22_g3782 [Coprinellus aureogranulatus]